MCSQQAQKKNALTQVELKKKSMAVTLFPHQHRAVEWMQRTEQRPRMVHDQPHGGILAHAMGLGKTITMLSMVKRQGLDSTIVVCPKSVLMQWRDEALRILELDADREIVVYHGNDRQRLLDESNPSRRLVLTTFDIVRMESKAPDGRDGANVSGPLQTHWDRIILDEAHRICEQGSKTAKAIRSLKARNRWCVTGTPFKNGVADLVALSKFLLVPPYCNSTWWRYHGQNAHKLREWRNAFLNIQDKSVLDLPGVNEVTVLAHREATEERVMRTVRSATLLSPLPLIIDEIEEAAANPQQEHELLKIMRLRQAANHPLMLTNNPAAMQFMLTAAHPVQTEGCSACGVELGSTPKAPKDATRRKRTWDVMESDACDHKLCAGCSEEMLVCPCCVALALPTVHVDGKTWRHSAKTKALWTYVSDALGGNKHAKLVLFSQWTTCLDLLASMLDVMGVRFARFDGRVNSIDERGDIIAEFRDEPSCSVLLTSLGAGGEGLNLTFASHVILMEPYWNVAAEQQAVDRLHRIGQTQTTNVLRLFTADSIENWVQDIQAKKSKELERLLSGKEHDTGRRNKPQFRVVQPQPHCSPSTTRPDFSTLGRFLAVK